MVGDVPITRYWLIPTEVRPKMFTPHPSMSSDEIRERTQKVWDRFYNWSAIWQRSACVPNLRRKHGFIVMLSKLYRQMYAGTGISTTARGGRSRRLGALDGEADASRLFQAKPMPELQSPVWALPSTATLLRTALDAGMPKEVTPFVVLPGN
jgi:hypothetical protein